eukprot:1181624-Prorocentrum_minimum.AAC.5
MDAERAESQRVSKESAPELGPVRLSSYTLESARTVGAVWSCGPEVGIWRPLESPAASGAEGGEQEK